MEENRLRLEQDALNVKNLVCFEQLLRRQILLALAAERNPQHPDFSGLAYGLGEPVVKGAAAARAFREWVSSRQKEQAQIWKQQRLSREESGRGRGGGGGGGPGRGGGRGRGRGRGGDDAGGGGAPPPKA